MANGSTLFYALYAHLSVVLCKQGDRVTARKILGFTGRTGNARNQPPHLHFEIASTPDLRKARKNQLDPAVVLGDFLSTTATGDASVVESSYLIEIIDLYEKTKNRA